MYFLDVFRSLDTITVHQPGAFCALFIATEGRVPLLAVLLLLVLLVLMGAITIHLSQWWFVSTGRGGFVFGVWNFRFESRNFRIIGVAPWTLLAAAALILSVLLMKLIAFSNENCSLWERRPGFVVVGVVVVLRPAAWWLARKPIGTYAINSATTIDTCIIRYSCLRVLLLVVVRRVLALSIIISSIFVDCFFAQKIYGRYLSIVAFVTVVSNALFHFYLYCSAVDWLRSMHSFIHSRPSR